MDSGGACRGTEVKTRVDKICSQGKLRSSDQFFTIPLFHNYLVMIQVCIDGQHSHEVMMGFIQPHSAQR